MKPFGTHVVGVQKKRILNVFMATHTSTSPIFLKYGPRIAEDLSMPFQTQEDRENVFQSLHCLSSHETGEDLPKGAGWSWDTASEFPKMGSWFSWNRVANSQLKEWWLSKMSLEDHVHSCGDQDIDLDELNLPAVDGAVVNDPVAELRKLKMSGSGLPLAEKLMTSDVLATAKCLFICTKAIWSHYTDLITTVQTPQDSLAEEVRLSSKWTSAPHIFEMFRKATHVVENLTYMGVSSGNASTCGLMVVELTWNLAHHTIWSDAVRHSQAPECFADILSSNAEIANESGKRMQQCWKMWLFSF